MWTLILAAAFVVILIGGIALYRRETHKVPIPEKVEPTKPETKEEVEEKTEEEQPVQQEPFNVKETLKELREKEKLVVHPETLQKLINYIHAEEGKQFDKDKIKNALLKKKWPENIVYMAFRDD